MAIHRIEVALKAELRDAAGETIRQDFRDLGLSEVTDVRTVRVFVVEGDISPADAEFAGRELFHDKVADMYSVDSPVLGGMDSGTPGETPGETPSETPKGPVALEIVRKPGVMDPVQESAMRGLRLLGLMPRSVRTARRVLIRSGHTPDELVAAAKKFLANVVIEDVVVGRPEPKPPPEVHYEFKEMRVPVCEVSDEDLMRISTESMLSLNLDEMRTIQQKFRDLGREPRDVELETLAQTWSEHCGHKTFRGTVRMKRDGEDEVIDNLLKNTIMKVTADLAKSWCLSVFKDNAGVIAFDDEWAICFKVETHNHPSAIEPYGGAGTGIGGVIRDPMGTGLGAKPVASTDVFCFAPIDYPRETLPPGVLHPKRVMKGVVAGVRDYGNRMGIPTVNGAICFDERYVGNPLVYCGNVGLMPRVIKGQNGAGLNGVEKHPRAGDRIFVVGGRTGRDGIHGVTFASVELHEESETVSSGAVQIGNAIEEKKMADVILKARDQGLYDAITDCGGGGLSSAIGEMGEDLGARVELSLVPLKYQGLCYTEIWISEAQERMVLSVPPKKADELKQLFASEDVDATDVGEFTGDGRLVLAYEGREVCDLPMEFLHHGYPQLEREAKWTAPSEVEVDAASLSKDLGEDLRKLLGTPDIASKEWVIRQYDHEVQGGSVLKPLVGPCEGPGDGAVVCPVLGSERAVVLACGINTRTGDLDPYRMGAGVVDEAVRNAVACGADIDRLALLDNFCWGNTNKPEVLGSLVLAAKGASDAAHAFGTPFISGKDSLNNEFRAGGETITIPPTLLISAIGVIEDWQRATSMDLKETGSLLYVVGLTKDEFGGSAFLKLHGKTGGTVPEVELELASQTMRAVSGAIGAGLARSCHDISEGGLAVAAAEMAFAGDFGLELDLAWLPTDGQLSDTIKLFSESASRFLVEVAPDQREKAFMDALGEVPAAKIGTVTLSKEFRIKGAGGAYVIDRTLEELLAAWRTGLQI